MCTSLLPDKVVFFIVNNMENIEGASQILRSIQKVERLPDQKPIDITFALTRIPTSETDEDRKRENQIVENIKALLNKNTEDLENQLNIQDISILHSDRELELSESLRLNQEKISRDIPLLRDYLDLFSKIILSGVSFPLLSHLGFEEKPDSFSVLYQFHFFTMHKCEAICL